MPTDLSLQAARREAILDILKNEVIARQEDLVRALRDRGVDATQSSVSRDLKELGVAKVGDRYLAPQNVGGRGSGDSFGQLAGFVTSVATAGPHLTVVRTAIGAAQSVAVALDEASWPEVVGTISGDDTIFVATASPRQQQQLLARLAKALPGARHP